MPETNEDRYNDLLNPPPTRAIGEIPVTVEGLNMDLFNAIWVGASMVLRCLADPAMRPTLSKEIFSATKEAGMSPEDAPLVLERFEERMEVLSGLGEVMGPTLFRLVMTPVEKRPKEIRIRIQFEDVEVDA